MGNLNRLGVLHLLNNSLESCGIVEGEIGEHLTVHFYARLVDETHELGVRQILLAGGSVDTLNPQSAEIALLILAVAVSVGKTLFPSVFSYGPHIFAATEITTGEFQDFLTTCSGSNMVY